MGAINTANARVKLHRITGTGSVPTVPVTEDFTSASFSSTDILIGEGCINVTDGKYFYRYNDGIKKLDSGISDLGIIHFPDTLTYSNDLAGDLARLNNFGLALRTGSKLLDMSGVNFLQLDDSFTNLTLSAPTSNAQMNISAANGYINISSFTCSISNDLVMTGDGGRFYSSKSFNQIDLDYASNGRLVLSNDNGGLSDTYIMMYSNLILNTNGQASVTGNTVALSNGYSTISVGAILNNGIDVNIGTNEFTIGNYFNTLITVTSSGTYSGMIFNQGLPSSDPGVPGQLYEVGGQVFISL